MSRRAWGAACYTKGLRLSTADASDYIAAMTVAAPDWAEAAEARLLDAAVRLAPELGWGGRLAQAAAREAGLDKATMRLLLPRGAADLAALLWRRHDDRAMAELAAVDAASLKIRERIRTAVTARVEAAAADAEAEKRAAAWAALPHHAPLTLRLAWATADKLWRWAGDVATDENHYTKRAILAGVLLSTSLVRMSGGREAAAAHLDAQIGRVMRFEMWKAGLPKPSEIGDRVAGSLGRLRYGARVE